METEELAEFLHRSILDTVVQFGWWRKRKEAKLNREPCGDRAWARRCRVDNALELGECTMKVWTLALLVVMGLSLPAAATPVGCDGTPTPDGKVFPEPVFSLTYVTFAEFECGIQTLNSRFPERMEVVVLGKSEAGYSLYDIRLTDEAGAQDKPRLFVMSSIHANEFGPREGAVRMIEEMVDPQRRGADPFIQDLLTRFVVHFTFANPDGWVAGEPLTNAGQGFQYTRANSTGFDLNRNFPVKGWFAYDNADYFQQEGVAVAQLLQEHAGEWFLGTDNHGQLADSYLAAGLQIVGEFDYQKSETLARFADGIAQSMGNYLSTSLMFEVQQVVGEYAGAYRWGTLYDILGYSASGSSIDYYNTRDTIAGTGFATELSYNNYPAGSNRFTYLAPLNQIWVDSIRAINYTMFEQALNPKAHVFELGGRVAYLFDPKRIRHDDANGVGNDLGDPGGFGQAPYDVSRMQFFEDLAGLASQALQPVRMAELLTGTVDASDFDSLVLANDAAPEAVADLQQWYTWLGQWVRDGGNLLLTDAALQDLPELLADINPDDIRRTAAYVGSVEEFTDRDHPLNAGLRGVASQTYDTVPIGMRFGNGADAQVAPNWEVNQQSWEAAGGYTAGLHSAGFVIHGEIALGAGRIGILGALLPDPTEEYYHPFGLQNYAVTYTGYSLLKNHLDWQRPAQAQEPSQAQARGRSAQAGGALSGWTLVGLCWLLLVAHRRRRPPKVAR